MEVQAIRNLDRITDYLTISDEIAISFGLADLFYYTFAKDFSMNDTVVLPPSAISFPCFYNQAFWLQANEIDTFRNDKTRLVLDCNKLVLGLNVITFTIYENKDLKLNTA